MTLIDLIGVVVAALLTVSFVRHAVSRTFWREYLVFRVLSRGRWARAVLLSWIVVVVVLVIGVSLVQTWPTLMGWTWLRLLSTPSSPEAGRNLLASGLTIPGFAWLFLALLAVNVPRLARNEELTFRKGFKDPRSIAFQSVKFGLAHCLVGVPIGFGLALGLAGAWFAFQYLQGGVRRSTAYHCIHNWTLLAMAAVWMASS